MLRRVVKTDEHATKVNYDDLEKYQEPCHLHVEIAMHNLKVEIEAQLLLCSQLWYVLHML